MAYNLSDRFPAASKYYTLLDPGAYQHDDHKTQSNKVPFLSATPRVTQAGNRIWTHTIYDAELPPKIPNCIAFISTVPRFKAFTKKELEEFLCRCGLQDPCECDIEGEDKEDVICQAKVPKCIFKGHPPRSMDAPKIHIKRKSVESPPFYNSKVEESTAFYQGCKWSSWTSKRSIKSLEQRPGPSDYTLEKELTPAEICAEIVRHEKRKSSKQLRFIEMVQQRNISEGLPGPATYSPELLKSINTTYYGSKGDRFPTSKYDERPGPAHYIIKRDFDLPEVPEYPCHAKLPVPSCFGIKAMRFKPRKEEGPSPASYDSRYRECIIQHCSTTPFGSSVQRFKSNIKGDEEDEEIIADDEPENPDENAMKRECPAPTWEFKSKTIRMKPLTKKPYEQSPADLPQSRTKIERSRLLQTVAPFYSSQGRFQPWYNWMSVHGLLKTPGPAYYCLEKPKCLPAVTRGPLCRAARFREAVFQTPAPNAYDVGGGVETILDTSNERLKDNIREQHTFIWKPPVERRKLSYEEQEALLLEKSIKILDTDPFDTVPKPPVIAHETSPRQEKDKPKLLRCFLK